MSNVVDADQAIKLIDLLGRVININKLSLGNSTVFAQKELIDLPLELAKLRAEIVKDKSDAKP